MSEALDNLRADLAAYASRAEHPPSGTLGTVLRVVMLPRLQAVALFRLSQALQPKSSLVASLVKTVNQLLTGCDIAAQATIAGGVSIPHPQGVVIGPSCVLGADIRVMSGVVIGAGPGGSPVIGNDVLLGTHSVIVGGITIGDHVSIGIGCVVNQDVPDGGRVRAARSAFLGPKAKPDPEPEPED
jgi:serine O-acetyltransferase